MNTHQEAGGNAARTVIVTGASRGIGRASAIRLARDFGTVVIAARSAGGLEEAAQAINAAGAVAHPVAIDLRLPDAGQTLVDAAFAKTGRIDAIANIAGQVPQSDLMDMTDAEWDDGLSMKLHGARRIALAGWPHLKASGGSLLFMSGATAVAPKAALAGVSAINAAILAMAKAFAERGLVDGIQVNSVQPGAVMTSRRLGVIERYAEREGLTTQDAILAYARELGIARYGEPEDIAELVAFLLSPRARWITGSTMRIDGGEARSI
ncbi:MAG: SDR family oxidoreductase [Sphingomonas sp.]|jgi:3-oxoacyl-[acyl-carrier protein] reductase